MKTSSSAILAVSLLSKDSSIICFECIEEGKKEILMEEARTIVEDFQEDSMNERQVVTESGLWMVREEEQGGIVLLLESKTSRDQSQDSLQQVQGILGDWSQVVGDFDGHYFNYKIGKQLKALLVPVSKRMSQASYSIEMARCNIQNGLEKMITNQDTLITIENQSDDLLLKATSFNKSSASLKRKMQRQQMILRLALFMISLSIVLYIYFMYLK